MGTQRCAGDNSPRVVAGRTQASSVASIDRKLYIGADSGKCRDRALAVRCARDIDSDERFRVQQGCGRRALGAAAHFRRQDLLEIAIIAWPTTRPRLHAAHARGRRGRRRAGPPFDPAAEVSPAVQGQRRRRQGYLQEVYSPATRPRRAAATASVPTFTASSAATSASMPALPIRRRHVGHGGKWTYEHLANYLHDPKGYIPNNKMAFVGVSDNAELADLLAYLRTLSDAARFPLAAVSAAPAPSCAGRRGRLARGQELTWQAACIFSCSDDREEIFARGSSKRCHADFHVAVSDRSCCYPSWLVGVGVRLPPAFAAHADTTAACTRSRRVGAASSPPTSSTSTGSIPMRRRAAASALPTLAAFDNLNRFSFKGLEPPASPCIHDTPDGRRASTSLRPSYGLIAEWVSAAR